MSQKARHGDVSVVPGAKPAPFPGFVQPCSPALREMAPSGGRWSHEIKFDGYRTQAHLRNGRPAIYTRAGYDWTRRFQPIADALATLPATDLILDGEAVVADSRGIPDFGLLHADLAAGRKDRLLYYAFDLLYLHGIDLRGALIRRHELLGTIGNCSIWFGLRDPGGKLWSLVGFGHGPHAAGGNAVPERGYTRRRAPANAASYLISRALRLGGWSHVKAYSDPRFGEQAWSMRQPASSAARRRGMAIRADTPWSRAGVCSATARSTGATVRMPRRGRPATLIRVPAAWHGAPPRDRSASRRSACCVCWIGADHFELDD